MIQFQIEASDLQKALQLSRKASPSRSSLPVLTNTLIVCTGFHSVKFTTTNSTEWVETSAPLLCNTEPFELLVPTTTLTNTAQTFSGTVTVSLEDRCMRLADTTRQVEIPVSYNVADYPQRKTEDGTILEVAAAELVAAINQVTFAASNDPTKQVLCGVNVRVHDGLGHFTATNGHHLACTNAEIDGDDCEFTIPTATCELLSFALKNIEQDVSIVITNTDVRFSFGSIVQTRKLNGAYPRLAQLIPQQFKTEMQIDATAVVSALKAIKTITDSTRVIFSFSELGCLVKTRNSETYYEQMLEGSFRAFEFSVNPNYVLAGLSKARALTLKFNSPTDAIVFEDVELDYLYLCMPLKIRN